MDMTYDGALVMPMGCAMMNEDEMTYVEGGYFYKKSFSYKGSQAYKELKSSGDAAWGLVIGASTGGALAGGVLGAVVGFGLSESVFSQWADTYYAAAQSIYGLRSSKKTVKFYETLTGAKAFLNVTFTQV